MFRYDNGMLLNLQFLRGVAALGVVFFHTDYRLAGDWHTEFFGVSTFFVISGFIMCLITRENADDFLKRRLVRVVPLYWLCTFAFIFVTFRFAIFEPSTWLELPAGRPDEPLWAYVSRSLLFLPIEDKYPILNVGWTLNFEIYFYLLFAAALWINRRFAPLMVAGFLVAVYFADGTVCTTFPCNYYSQDYIQYFIAGIAIYYALGYVARGVPRRPAVWVGLGLIAICYGSQFVGPWWSAAIEPRVYVLVAAAAPMVIVASALIVESAGCAVTWRPLILIGDASYAIYLTHTILFDMLGVSSDRWLHLPTPKDSTIVMLAYLAVAIVTGIVVHLMVEKPMLRVIRRKRGARSGVRASNTPHDVVLENISPSRPASRREVLE